MFDIDNSAIVFPNTNEWAKSKIEIIKVARSIHAEGTKAYKILKNK